VTIQSISESTEYVLKEPWGKRSVTPRDLGTNQSAPATQEREPGTLN
jgi:hypothetical protein